MFTVRYAALLVSLATLSAAGVQAGPNLTTVVSQPSNRKYWCKKGSPLQDCGSLCANTTCAEGARCVESHCGTCKAQCIPIKTGCKCTGAPSPVCGSDGNSYPSRCEACRAGVRVRSKGNCKNDKWCRCRLTYDPVCGSDGKVYINTCVATTCAGVQVVGPETCSVAPSCPCPYIFQPVCGVNNVTYANDCVAACVKVQVAYQGECGTGSDCSAACRLLRFKPVCGINNQTYGTACEAACARVPVARNGTCRPWSFVLRLCFIRPAREWVCGEDSRTHGLPICAEANGNRNVIPGKCACDTESSGSTGKWPPTCKVAGEMCTLRPGGQCPCCDGGVCWPGPVVSPGAQFGTCVAANESQPLHH